MINADEMISSFKIHIHTQNKNCLSLYFILRERKFRSFRSNDKISERACRNIIRFYSIKVCLHLFLFDFATILLFLSPLSIFVPFSIFIYLQFDSVLERTTTTRRKKKKRNEIENELSMGKK